MLWKQMPLQCGVSSWLKQCPRSAPPGDKLITQHFYTSFRSAAEGGHALWDAHQHRGWITCPRLAPTVPYRTAPPLPTDPCLLASAARGGSQQTLDLVKGAWHQAVPMPSSAL